MNCYQVLACLNQAERRDDAMNISKPELFQKTEVEIEINGKPHMAQVYVYIQPCDSDPFDMDFENEDAKQVYADQLNSGTIENVYISVQAQLCAERGDDSLGGCHIGNGYGVLEVIQEHGMIENAVAELKVNLENKYSELKKLFEMGAT